MALKSLPALNAVHSFPSYREMSAPLAPHLNALQAFMEEQANCFEPEILPLVRYCLEKPGKRLRPLLVFSSGWPSAGDSPVSRDHIRLAAAVELIHLATLVHDDILDGATLRHNRSTLNESHGSGAAVLVGDALFSQALCVAAEFPESLVCREIAQATRRICAGEISQTLREGGRVLSAEDYFHITGLKTAELFRLSCWLGARFSDDPQHRPEAAAQFGQGLGLAYQLFDDAVDLLETESSAGKTLGTDILTGKYTLPLIFLLEGLPADRQQEFLQAAAEDNQLLASRLHSQNIPERIAQAFGELMDEAEGALEPFEGEPFVEKLRQIGGFIRGQMAALLQREG